jgi:uncharacterized membrane protein YkgB
MIYFYYITNKSQIVKTYKDKLPIDLQNRYEKISKERSRISYTGYALGFIISLFIIYYNINLKKQKLSKWSIVCLVMATCFLTNYFYYILSPKSDWMLNHTNSPEQVKAWLQMYRNMQINYHAGIVLGIVGVGVLAFAFHI